MLKVSSQQGMKITLFDKFSLPFSLKKIIFYKYYFFTF